MTRTSSIWALALAAAGASGVPVQAGDFAGPYIGAAMSAGTPLPGMIDWEGSAFIGYNWGIGDRIFAGTELDLTYNPKSLWGTGAAIGTLDARLGYLVTEDFMLYGRTGTGYTNGNVGSYVWDAGAGGEYMLDNGITIRGEFDRVDPFDAGMDTQLNGRLGVIMNF